MSVTGPGEDLKTPEVISDEEAIAFLRAVIAERDFDRHDPDQNARFLTNVAHWSLEAFGQSNNRGEWFLHPAGSYGEGFDHSELPYDLQQVVATERFGEVYVGKNNGVSMKSAPIILEEDPVIPKWDMLNELVVFDKMVRAAANDPEIMAAIRPSRFLIIPGVHLDFKPAPHFRWGLQYVLRSTDVKLVPYGEYDHTQVPFQYAAERQNNHLKVALTACDLIMLAVRHAQRHVRPCIPIDMTDTLRARIEGLADIPVEDLECQPKPGNSMKNLLVQELLQIKQQG